MRSHGSRWPSQAWSAKARSAQRWPAHERVRRTTADSPFRPTNRSLFATAVGSLFSLTLRPTVRPTLGSAFRPTRWSAIWSAIWTASQITS